MKVQDPRAALLRHLQAPAPHRLFAGALSGDIATVAIEGVDALEPHVARFMAHLGMVAAVPLVILAVLPRLDLGPGADGHGAGDPDIHDPGGPSGRGA